MAKRKPRRTRPTGGRTRRAPEMVRADSAWAIHPDEVQRTLESGREDARIEELIGPEASAELARLAREANAKRRRGGPRVLILPGIMGSTLGKHGLLIDQVYWLDPIRFSLGVARKLALAPGGDKQVVPLSALWMTYLKLKLRLTIAGYDADYLPFDWRQSLDDIGRQVAAQIEADGADEVSLVAHSMGGLAARAALKLGSARARGKVSRLIMLGTPNYGSFAPVQALRGTYSTVQKLARLDLTADASDLVKNVFSTFPGLYQMLPAQGHAGGANWFDPGAWPAHGLQPRTAILKAAAAAQSWLAADESKFFLIAGVNQQTVVGARLVGDDFEYQFSNEGDGTVPLGLAKLADERTYYIEEEHGALPNNAQVAKAVCELIASGRTSVLSLQRPAAPRVARRTVRESELHRAAAATRGKPLSYAERRDVLREFAAPVEPEPLAAALAAPPSTAAPLAAPVRPVHWNRLSVGRVRQHRLDIQLANCSITDVDARAYVLALYQEVAPNGAAASIDARLEGAIKQFMARRMFSANVGETFIMPANRRQLRAEMVLFAGLGYFDRFDDEVLKAVAENVIRTFIATKVEDFATVLLGAGSGRPLTALLESLCRGLVTGLLDADRDHDFRRITLCETDLARYQEIKQAVYVLASTDLFEDVELCFTELEVRPAPEVVVGAPRLARPALPEPAYLLVREERASRAGSVAFRSSVLTADGEAAIISAAKEVAGAEIDELLRQLETSDFSRFNVGDFGARLAQLVLHESVAAALLRMRERHLVVVHDAPSSRFPWETLLVDDWSPALGQGVSHRYMADNLSVAKFSSQKASDEILRVLIVSDPTQNLPGAKQEGDDVAKRLKRHALVVDRLEGRQATRNAVLRAFRSGGYDIVHYAGHAHFNAEQRAQSGILCYDDEITAVDLAGLGALPSLVFFNACESGRIRAIGPRAKEVTVDHVEAANGMAEALLRGGIANFIGTYWPVGDDSASAFSDAFYDHILDGEPLEDAVQAGRLAAKEIGSQDWADYIHYGDRAVVLRGAAVANVPSGD